MRWGDGVAINKTVAGVLLAGGRSSRMGVSNKGLLEAGGMTLLERVKMRARPQVSALLLNVNGDRTPFARFGLPMKADSIEDFAGPLAGILTALEWARDDLPDVEWVASFPVDTPMIPADLVRNLRNSAISTEATIACAASGGQFHPVVGLWPVRLAGDLRTALEHEGVRKVDEWTARYKVAFAEWSTDEGDPFFNVNTKADLKALEKRLAAATGKASAR